MKDPHYVRFYLAGQGPIYVGVMPGTSTYRKEEARRMTKSDAHKARTALMQHTRDVTEVTVCKDWGV